MSSTSSGNGHRWIGQPLGRREDKSLLTGAARFMPDLTRPGLVHAGFVRSPVAHADVGSIDGEGALALDGVLAVVTHDDLGAVVAQPSTHELGTRPTPYYAVAKDRVRYVGEAVAVVVGETPTAVHDAIELVDVSYGERAIVTDTLEAAATDSPVIHDGWPDNVAGTFDADMGDVDAAIRAADVVLTRRLAYPRQTACSMEGRGALAEWDPHAESLTV